MLPVCSVKDVAGLHPVPTPYESEVMTITGESPSPMEVCDHREPEGHCVAVRRGGKSPEGSSQAQNHPAKEAKPDSAGGRGRVCGVKTKPGATASCGADTRHIKTPTPRPS